MLRFKCVVAPEFEPRTPHAALCRQSWGRPHRRAAAPVPHCRQVSDVIANTAKSQSDLAAKQDAFYQTRPQEARQALARPQLDVRVANAELAAKKQMEAQAAVEEHERKLIEEKKAAYLKGVRERTEHAKALVNEMLQFMEQVQLRACGGSPERARSGMAHESHPLSVHNA